MRIDRAVQQLHGVIDDLDARIATLDNELAALLKDGAWAQSAPLLRTIPGIGPLTTAWLLGATVNVTTCTSAESLTRLPGAHRTPAAAIRRSRRSMSADGPQASP